MVAGGLNVEADVGQRRAAAHVDRAFEIRTHERADGIAIASGSSGSFRAEQNDVVGELHVLAPRALCSAARAPVGLAQQNTSPTVIHFDDGVAKAWDLCVPPSQIVESVPRHRIQWGEG